MRETGPTHAREVIVITGAGGFLGSRVIALVRRAAPRARVIAIVRRRRRERPLMTGVETIAGDLRGRRIWERLPSDVTHLIHLAAAIPRRADTADDPAVLRDNLLPIVHLLGASCGWRRLRAIVYASSIAVYGRAAQRLRESTPTRPTTLYGAAKLAGEQLLDVLSRRGIAVASLRYSSMYGAGQYSGTVLPVFVDRARHGLPLQVFDGTRVQDFVHVDDAARATWLACRKRRSGAFNVGAGRSVSMRALARAVVGVFCPRDGGRIVESRSARSDPGVRLDIRRSRRELGFTPRLRLTDGLKTLAREAAAGRPWRQWRQ